MNETLKALYDNFYVPQTASELTQEIKFCHKQLVERLEKPECKLVLRIIDAKDQHAENLSIDSFICGFKLAWQLSAEVNHYKNERSIHDSSARFTYQATDE